MGRHTRPDEPGESARPRRIALAVRHTIPASVATPAPGPPGADATTLTVRPFAPAAALDGHGVRPGPAPVPAGPVPPAGPPARLSRRDRRAARHEQDEKAAIAARLARANRRNRQVAAFAVPAPRSADPSSISGPLSIDALATARPPWSTRS